MSASKNKTAVIIQARMGSSRLPGKVMKKLCGRTVLAHVIDRVRRAHGVDAVIVATSTKPDDDVIEAESLAEGASCFRGSESDVLSRYQQAAQQAQASTVVRVTSDCPLYDPTVLTAMLKVWDQRHAGGYQLDYLSNGIKRTFPRGLDTEICTFEALDRAHRNAHAPEEREHVTIHIYRHPEKFSIENFANPKDLSGHRWTLDTDDDWRLIEEIYGRLYRPGEVFSTDDVLRLLEREPALTNLNAHIRQKEIGGH